MLESYLKPKSAPSRMRAINLEMVSAHVLFLERCAIVLVGVCRIEAVGRGHADVSWTRCVVGSPSAPSKAEHGAEYINVPIPVHWRPMKSFHNDNL